MNISDILAEFHIAPQFSPAAMRETEKFGDEVEKKDLKGRLDLTEKVIFTIDGDDAKDFDDAVSLEKNENGNYILGVHIADVSHYVTDNSPLDRAAFSRGTSVYLIDTVVPMLPFKLSNGLLSLKPGELRLTLSVFMEITKNGSIKNYGIYESYIKSACRMTYAGAARALRGDKDFDKKYLPFLKTLRQMYSLAKILKKKRMQRGAIEFISRESQISLDESGRAVNVQAYKIEETNFIIEEFMLAANETVAKHMSKNKLPAVFRIHEEPSEEKVIRLLEILPLLGVNSALNEGRKPKDFQKILTGVSGTKKENIINYIVLRSMSMAKYAEVNKGHFALAAKYYCHFTSPIRRYPDLLTHRILKLSIHKGFGEKTSAFYTQKAFAAAVNSSETEINAADAEAKWNKVKKIEYMEDKEGEIFEASISHITASGFFAELDNTVEGFVSARSMNDDVYIFEENKLHLRGITSGKTYSIGDRVKVKVDFADSETLTLDLLLCSENKSRKNKKVNSKAAQKAQKTVKKELRLQSKERKEKRFKAEYAKDIAEERARNEVLTPFKNLLSLKREEARFVRASFDDFWHICSKGVERAVYFEEDIEKNIDAAVFSFDNFVCTVCESLSVNVSGDFVKKGKKTIRKILKEYVKNLSK